MWRPEEVSLLAFKNSHQSSTNSVGRTGHPHAKNEDGALCQTMYHHHGIKNNPQGIKSLIRAKTTKFLKENIDVNHHNVESGTGFSGKTPKVQATKENIYI